MFTLLIILLFIALCLIYTIQYQITNDYKPYRCSNINISAYSLYEMDCEVNKYSIFSLKDYIDE